MTQHRLRSALQDPVCRDGRVDPTRQQRNDLPRDANGEPARTVEAVNVEERALADDLDVDLHVRIAQVDGRRRHVLHGGADGAMLISRDVSGNSFVARRAAIAKDPNERPETRSIAALDISSMSAGTTTAAPYVAIPNVRPTRSRTSADGWSVV